MRTRLACVHGRGKERLESREGKGREGPDGAGLCQAWGGVWVFVLVSWEASEWFHASGWFLF